MAQASEKIRIGITQGDPNGIGTEVITKALSNSDILELFTPIIFGTSHLFAEMGDKLQIEDLRIKRINSLSDVTDGVINILECGSEDFEAKPGIPSEEAGREAIVALEAASEAVNEGEIDLLVTAPINKNTVYGEKFPYTGHTEYLEDKFRVEGGRALMILAAGNLRVALVTTHIPLAQVGMHITKESVEEKIRDFNLALKMDFGCERPKIAVLSLNPHCGDGGVLGREEADIITPAIEQCKSEGIMAFGPLATDGFFGSEEYTRFDGVLAMYHDQGLAPFKAIAGALGINFTAGLNIIRTSPDHGTAYDKAGRGIADETSMREAIYAAIDIARRRTNYLDASENPLEIRTPAQRNSKRDKEKQAEAASQEQEIDIE